MIAGRESVVIELIPSADYLIAKSRNSGYGAVFLMVPVMGDTTSWYRFKRPSDLSGVGAEKAGNN